MTGIARTPQEALGYFHYRLSTWKHNMKLGRLTPDQALAQFNREFAPDTENGRLLRRWAEEQRAIEEADDVLAAHAIGVALHRARHG